MSAMNELIPDAPAPSLALSFRLDAFDGPLDLLLTLITKQKIDIYDIPISLILEQYLDHIQMMNENNVEVASEFIVMAAELLYIKSKMLLPKEETDGEDPRKELVEALIAYSFIRDAALRLSDLERRFYMRYYPTPKPLQVRYEVPFYDKSVLSEAMHAMHADVKEEKEKRKIDSVAGVFVAKTVSVESKIIYILKRMVRAIPLGNSVSFSALFEGEKNRTKPDLVATFLALLELVSTGRISYSRSGSDYVISLNRDNKKPQPDHDAGTDGEQNGGIWF
ncbi:MAG: segregation/condensation protein A [Clostridia bacterium]|nr:segregation/condensation protein A [Clostridia bacterium]